MLEPATHRMLAMGKYESDDLASAIKARDFKNATDLITHTLCGEGFDASDDGTGRCTPLVPVHCFDAGQSDVCQYGDQAGTLGTDCGRQQAVAFSSKDHGGDASDISPTLRAGGHANSHANAGAPPAVAFQTRIARNGRGYADDVLPALNGADAGATSDMRPCIATAAAVRRLTPRECERLQGFPDDFTLIPYRKGMMADGPRYKMLGNSMAVPVLRWIGERIQAVEDISKELGLAA